MKVLRASYAGALGFAVAPVLFVSALKAQKPRDPVDPAWANQQSP